jgi:ribose-phosphate pyrophosphokinase
MTVTLFGGRWNIECKWWTFPGGERNVQILGTLPKGRGAMLTIVCPFKNSDSIIDVMLLNDAIRHVNPEPHIRLVIPYFPAARQDRVMNPGEPFALRVMAQMINSCKFKEVEVWDPHSDVLPALFEPGVLTVRTQWDLWKDIIKTNHGEGGYAPNEKVLVSPDAGALKKIYKLAKETGISVVEATKQRDVKTGQIVNTQVDVNSLLKYNIIYIVDDICDGGRTFIDLANVIREGGYVKKMVLCVTHGIFSRGLDPLSVFDKVYTINNMSTENLSAFNI